MNRLTHRIGYKTFLIPTKAECSERFCIQAESCSEIHTRQCPYLKVLDTIADIEDLCEEYGIINIKHLKDVLTYCNIIGVPIKILRMYTEGESDYEQEH